MPLLGKVIYSKPRSSYRSASFNETKKSQEFMQGSTKKRNGGLRISLTPADHVQKKCLIHNHNSVVSMLWQLVFLAHSERILQGMSSTKNCYCFITVTVWRRWWRSSPPNNFTLNQSQSTFWPTRKQLNLAGKDYKEIIGDGGKLYLLTSFSRATAREFKHQQTTKMAVRLLMLRELHTATQTEDDCRGWLHRNSQLSVNMACPRCSSVMKERHYSHVSDEVIWRYPPKQCRATVSVRKGSFILRNPTCH